MGVDRDRHGCGPEVYRRVLCVDRGRRGESPAGEENGAEVAAINNSKTVTLPGCVAPLKRRRLIISHVDRPKKPVRAWDRKRSLCSIVGFEYQT